MVVTQNMHEVYHKRLTVADCRDDTLIVDLPIAQRSATDLPATLGAKSLHAASVCLYAAPSSKAGWRLV
jgi:hypothetical protein